MIAFERKTPEEIASQFDSAQEALGTEFFVDQKRKEEVLEKDEEELKEKYPYRYQEYVKILRQIAGKRRENLKALKELEKESGEQISPEEKRELAELSSSDLETISHSFLSARDYIRSSNNLEKYIASYEKGQPEGFLREHQQDVFHNLVRFFQSGEREGYIEMPTGTGKTVMFVELIRALAGNRNGLAPLKSLVITSRQDLIEQTIGRDTQEKKGFAKFAPELKVSPYYADKKDLTGEVVITTYNSFIRLIEEGKIGGNFADVVIFDEAHHTSGPASRAAFERLGDEVIKIGLTATAEYSEEKNIESIFQNLIHRLELREAIELGILSDVRGVVYRTGTAVKDIEFSLNGDYNEKTLAQLNNEVRNRAALESIKVLAEHGKAGIVSCLPGGDLAHARQMAELIREIEIVDKKIGKKRNLRAEVVGQNVSQDDRQQIYKDFENGEIDFLTFVDVLGEGWDSDRAKVLINLRPTRSRVLATQRLGRILRKNDEFGEAIVIEFEDDFQGLPPYTFSDILDQRSIVQGGLLSGRRQRDGESLRGEQDLPDEVMELLEALQLNLEPVVERELVSDRKKLGANVMVFHGEVFMAEKALARYFGMNSEELAPLIEENPTGVEMVGSGGKEYYRIDDILRGLKNLRSYEKDLYKIHYEHGEVQSNLLLPLKVIAGVSRMKVRYFQEMLDQYGVEPTYKFDAYKAYDLREARELLEFVLEVKGKLAKHIFQDNIEDAEELKKFCQEIFCSKEIFSDFYSFQKGTGAFSKIGQEDLESIFDSLDDARVQRIRYILHCAEILKEGGRVVWELKKITITEFIPGIEEKLMQLEKKWNSSTFFKPISKQCARIREELLSRKNDQKSSLPSQLPADRKTRGARTILRKPPHRGSVPDERNLEDSQAGFI